MAGAMLRRAGVAIALLPALVLSGCGSDTAGSDRPAPLSTQRSGDPLPEASFRVLGSDEEVSTTEFLGTPTVINFWATWCAFCVDEMPDLERGHQALGDAVRFVGIDRQDNRDKAIALAEETGVSYLLLESPDGAYYNEVGARGMPTTLFVDGDGIIRHRHTGAVTEEELLALVEEHLGVTP